MQKQNRLTLYPHKKKDEEDLKIFNGYIYLNGNRYIVSIYPQYKDGKKYYGGNIKDGNEKKEAPRSFHEPIGTYDNIPDDIKDTILKKW